MAAGPGDTPSTVTQRGDSQCIQAAPGRPALSAQLHQIFLEALSVPSNVLNFRWEKYPYGQYGVLIQVPFSGTVPENTGNSLRAVPVC